ncbi:unnamed protein product, partial [Mesorhabditis belari]|uniref:UBX domain-containing protein 1 n=1 Tax=Mesorhabditis belari TaxID=2138241 RepID=A0AAF3ET03_9BILA
MSAVLQQLLEMGFEEARAKRAISASNGSVEAAMEWLIAHQDEPLPEEGSSVELVDQPMIIPDQTSTSDAPAAAANSFKCDDCGKLLKDNDALMFHAAKTNHENFSESTETIKALTPEELAAQREEIKKKLQSVREQKSDMDRKDEIEKEKRRREEGKLVIQRKEEQKELRQIAEDRRREKLEDERAKQRILDQIKADKEDRKARALGMPPPSHEPSKPQHVAVPPPKVDYKQATIQVRLPSGEAVRQTFDAKESLSAVRLWIEMHHNPTKGHFDLMTPFPRKKMDEQDYEAPLESLGLVPSAVLVMTRGQ